MSEPRYTLEQARRELDRRECARDGHDWGCLYTSGSLDPVALVCERCRRRLGVTGDAT